MRSAFPASAFLAACVACSQYDLVTTSTGQAFRIDQRTGDVAIVTDSGLTPLPILAALPRQAADSQDPLSGVTANRSRYWPADSVPSIGVKSALLVTRCRNGQLYYRLSLEPVPPRYPVSMYQPFTLRFGDEAGFVLAEVPLLKSDLTRVVDHAGRPSGLQVISRVPLSTLECKEIRGWSLVWRF